MADLIPLDNDGLQAFVRETIRQVLTANQEVESGLGVTINPRFKIAFSGLVTARGGLNAVERVTGTVSEPQVSEEVNEASVEKTTRDAEQSGANTELSKLTSLDSEAGTNTESGSNSMTGTQKETMLTRSEGGETSTGKNDSVSTTEDTAKDSSRTSNSQANGTTTTTTTEYSR